MPPLLTFILGIALIPFDLVVMAIAIKRGRVGSVVFGIIGFAAAVYLIYSGATQIWGA